MGADFFSALDVSAKGLAAERVRMAVISNNLANANVTRTASGGPYKKQYAVFAAEPAPAGSFSRALDQARHGVQGVTVTGVVDDQRPPRLVYEPGHPDANPEGYVAYPNVTTIEEMADMLNAQRAYEANISAAQAAKAMAAKTLELGR